MGQGSTKTTSSVFGPRYSILGIVRVRLLKSHQDCRKRWFHSLDPSLRKGKWSEQEDQALRKLYTELGPKWKEIGKSSIHFPAW